MKNKRTTRSKRHGSKTQNPQSKHEDMLLKMLLMNEVAFFAHHLACCQERRQVETNTNETTTRKMRLSADRERIAGIERIARFCTATHAIRTVNTGKTNLQKKRFEKLNHKDWTDTFFGAE